MCHGGAVPLPHMDENCFEECKPSLAASHEAILVADEPSYTMKLLTGHGVRW